jgi:8-oxo-dGTP pyrophosphatase MutT (NUDIX family)
MQIVIFVEAYCQMTKTASLSSHAGNQLNYIKAILSRTKDTSKRSIKAAAVMIILTVINEKIYILFTHRTDIVSTHKDQVSFPGGLQELKDENLIQTAIRETNEEIGILINENNIYGNLPEQRSISGFQIHPFVCYIENLENIKLNQAEVKHIFTIPLDWILDHKNWSFETYKSPDGKERQVVFFQKYKNEIVWGITGQILVSFANLLLW